MPFLVACSALVNDEITKKCFDIGFNAIIESPMTVQKIESEILKHLRNDRLQKQILEDKIQRSKNSQQKSLYSIGALERVSELKDQNVEESESAEAESEKK